MQKTKFTVRVEGESLDAARQYASRHGTTITRLVAEYLHALARKEQRQDATPVLHLLTGTLRPDVFIDEYKAYLQQKYLGDEQATHID